MIYGFLYVGMIFSIASLWLFLAVLPKPDFIEKPIDKIKNNLREFLGSKEDQLMRKYMIYLIIKSNVLFLLLFNSIERLDLSFF